MADLLHGRLVALVDEGNETHLFIHPVDESGNEVLALHKTDEEGTPTEQWIDGLVEVRWDNEAGGYVQVDDGKSHNDVHHRNFASVSGTAGKLFDANGNEVYEGDAHHDEVLPDDPHYDGLKFLEDEISPRATGHTDSLRSEG